MSYIRMLFKNKTKVYVPVDDSLNPLSDPDTGMVRFRYENRAGATEYTTSRRNLSIIPGMGTLEEEHADEPVKPPKPRNVKMANMPAIRAGGDPIPPGTIVIYTDGGSKPNPGPTGCGVLMLFGKHVLEIWEYLGRSTNNVGELTAIKIGLSNIKNRDIPVIVYSDSNYAIGVLSGRMKATKNVELIDEIRRDMANFHKLVFLKVQAHVGITYNEHVDKLATWAREQRESGTRRGSLEN